MFRPEYLFVGAAFVVLAAIRVGRARGWQPGLAGAGLLLAALLLPIVPWTIRNVDVLDRVVPISTGSGKALYVGTYLPGRRRIPAGQGAALRTLRAQHRCRRTPKR